MSWDAYLAHREAKSNKRKRRKLFPDADPEISADSSDNEKVVPHVARSIRVIRADQIKSTPELLDNSFKKKLRSSNVISSFESESDDEALSSKKSKITKNPKTNPKKTTNNKKPKLVKIPKTPVNPISRTRQLDAVSPATIESFESASDSSCSALEATPPIKLEFEFKKQKLGEKNLSDIEEDESECLQPGSMFQHTQRTKKTKHSVKTINPTSTSTSDFRSNFNDFSDNQVKKPPQAYNKCSNKDRLLFSEQTAVPGAKTSAADWIKNLKSPEGKQQKMEEDESVKKSLLRKHPPGSLAYKAQRLNSFNRGEYQMWLHKNIATGNSPPFSEFCYYGKAKSSSTMFGLTCVDTQIFDNSSKSVIVLIPSTQKSGNLTPNSVLVVFPQFHCYIFNNVHHIFSSFHAQYFNANEHDFSKIPKVDHFLGVTENIPSQTSSISSEICRIPDKYIPIDKITSPRCIELYVCIYQISKNADNYLQVIGLDISDNIVIIEISKSLAERFWHQLALSLKVSCCFTSLKLAHKSLAMKCYHCFPQLQLFPITTKTVMFCLETVDDTDVKLKGDVMFDETLYSSVYTDRVTITCRYLTTIEYSGVYVSYVSTMFSSFHWITHSTSLSFPGNAVLRFSGLRGLTSQSYHCDELSSYELCVSADQLSYTYPYLNHIVDERELEMFTDLKPNIVAYNQYLPVYTPTIVSGVIHSIQYSERQFKVSTECCGVRVVAVILPSTLRMWLQTECIVEQELARLQGYKCRFEGVVVGRLLVFETDLSALRC